MFFASNSLGRHQ